MSVTADDLKRLQDNINDNVNNKIDNVDNKINDLRSKMMELHKGLRGDIEHLRESQEELLVEINGLKKSQEDLRDKVNYINQRPGAPSYGAYGGMNRLSTGAAFHEKFGEWRRRGPLDQD